MYCTNCGTKLPDEARFCPSCGAKVLPPAVPADEPVTEAPAAGPVIEEPVIAEPVIEAAEAVAAEIAEPVTDAAEEIVEPVIDAAEEVTAEIAEPVIEAVEEAAEPVVEAAEAAAAEIAEPVAGAAAAAVAGNAFSAIPEEPPKKKKTGLIAAIVAVIVIAAGVGGYFIYQNLPSTKLAKLRTQIASTIESKDYSGALGLIEQAYEFAPDDAELRRQYVECSQIILNEKYALRDLNEFIDGADKLIKDYPEAAEDLDPLVKQSYELLADAAIDTQDIPKMQAIKDRLVDVHNSGRFDFSSKINWIEDNIQHVELTNMFQKLADKMIPLIKSGDRAAVFETIRTEFISSGGSARKLAPNQSTVDYHYPLYSSQDDTGRRLGLYYSKGHYFFYYGTYNGTRREGDAVWICADNLKTDTAYREYWAEGSWANDKPNGTFSTSTLSKYASSDTEQLIEAVAGVKDGLFEGSVTYTYPNEQNPATISGTFHNGIADVIMTTDPNGNEANVIMISEDGKAWMSRANINDPLGIYGYY